MIRTTKGANIYIYISTVALIVSLCLTVFFGYKTYLLSQQLWSVTEDREGLVFSLNCTKDGYDYLAIGNSITVHSTCDYWWTESGMCASSPDKDYFHLVDSRLQREFRRYNSAAVNFSVWETLHTDRSEMILHIKDYLCAELDLITIQLGENVSDLTTFETDFRDLITYIQEKSPNADILVIGDFWEKENRDQIKQTVADQCNVSFLSLAEISGNSEYTSNLGFHVYDLDGNVHIVRHAGVALHPNDRSMEYIAKGILEKILIE